MKIEHKGAHGLNSQLILFLLQAAASSRKWGRRLCLVASKWMPSFGWSEGEIQTGQLQENVIHGQSISGIPKWGLCMFVDITMGRVRIDNLIAL
jgi:hypothetical protein